MFRRVVSLLALQCVVLGQMVPVVFAHAHEGGQPAGHGSHPHAHLNPPRSSHGHHEHDCDGRHHDHTDDDCPSVPRPEEPSDHDSDAVYVAGADAVLTNRVAGDEGRLASFAGIGFSIPVVVVRAGLDHTTVNQNHPPPGQTCPIYVRHLAILI